MARRLLLELRRLTAHLDGADLDEALREVARQAGLVIRGALSAPGEPRTRTVDLDDVPLADALSRLLAGQSFLLTYGDGELKGVRLLGGSEIVASPSIAYTPAEVVDAEPSGAQLAGTRPVAIGGRLARAIGSNHTTFNDVIDVAMRHDDPRVRADALRIGFRIVDAEPDMRESMLYVLDHWDDAGLAGWLSKVAGTHAEDIARRTARNARWAPLRQRATAVARLFEADVVGGEAGN